MLIVRNRFQPLPQYPVDFESQPKVAGVMTGRASAIKTVRPVILDALEANHSSQTAFRSIG
jgi:hypothetical protein